MPPPAPTLKIRRFRRRFGIAAPKVVVRTHIPWPWYGAALLVLILGVAITVWIVAQRGEKAVLVAEVSDLRESLASSEAKLAGLRGSLGAEVSGVQLERTVRQQLQVRVKALESENAALKEEIAYFEHLVPLAGGEAAVRIERFHVTRDPEAGRYRYRLLMAFEASKQVREFKGALQISATYVLEGKDALLTLPEKNGKDASEMLVELKHFLRKEGEFRLPSAARLKSVEARLLQGGTLRAKRFATL